MDTKLLRQKILDLAIHGKLVPQDPNDEPASVLFERIKKEKEQLIKKEEIRRSKRLIKTSDAPNKIEKVLFEIPNGWMRVHVEDLFVINPKSILADDTEVGFVPMAYVDGGFSGKHIFERRKWGEVKKGFCHFKNGDIGIAKISPCFENLKSTIFSSLPNCFGAGTTELVILRSLGVIAKFYLYLFKSNWYIKEGTKDFKGVVGQQRVNKNIFSVLDIPLPPLVEQQRIVTEIDKWFALIDSIESNKVDLENTIKRTKSKILDIAIHGKLVPQDPDDEPASELLKRINPKAKINSDISHNRKIPKGWIICKNADVFSIIMGQSPKGENINMSKGIEFHQGKLQFTNKYLEPSKLYTSQPTKISPANSILLCVRAPVGVVNISKRRICIGRGLCSLVPKLILDIDYGYYYISTRKSHFEKSSTGTTFRAISGDVICNDEFMLPPLIEQRRIVSKIKELFAKIDVIQNSLEQ